MFPTAKEEVRVTQFANWTTFKKRIQSLISKWKKILPNQVKLQLTTEYPAINTGVMGFSKSSTRFMDRWHQETMKNIGFICDELSAQLLYPEYPHMLLDERWNGSPRFSWGRLGPHVEGADPRILHGHGKKFLKNIPEVQEAWWLPYYRRALETNFCNICEWTNSRRQFKGLVRPRNYISENQWDRLTEGLDVK
jgi:hypothetical protein